MKKAFKHQRIFWQSLQSPTFRWIKRVNAFVSCGHSFVRMGTNCNCHCPIVAVVASEIFIPFSVWIGSISGLSCVSAFCWRCSKSFTFLWKGYNWLGLHINVLHSISMDTFKSKVSTYSTLNENGQYLLRSNENSWVYKIV